MKYVEHRLPGHMVTGNGGYDRQLALDSVGAGWSSLINEVFDEKEKLHTHVNIILVKEKFGGLRIYLSLLDLNDPFEDFVISIEKKSFSICEQCGEQGSLKKSSAGYYKTLCDKHGFGMIEITSPF